jgi:hypothetical protein
MKPVQLAIQDMRCKTENALRIVLMDITSMTSIRSHHAALAQ